MQQTSGKQPIAAYCTSCHGTAPNKIMWFIKTCFPITEEPEVTHHFSTSAYKIKSSAVLQQQKFIALVYNFGVEVGILHPILTEVFPNYSSYPWAALIKLIPELNIKIFRNCQYASITTLTVVRQKWIYIIDIYNVVTSQRTVCSSH